MSMGIPSVGGNAARRDAASNRSDCYGRDFWLGEGRQNYSQPHYRLLKSARIINRLARGRECTLLDVGCGPATLQSLLRKNIQYYGIDMAIQVPAPNLIETDFLHAPVRFGDMHFDIVSVQGVFEYVGDCQSHKLEEIARLLRNDGTALVTYVNFDHRQPDICSSYSNVQPLREFRADLNRCFDIRRSVPTSYNWNHWEPGRRLLKAANMRVQRNLPLIGPSLAVEYFFICTPRNSLSSKRRSMEPRRQCTGMRIRGLEFRRPRRSMQRRHARYPGCPASASCTSITATPASAGA
jgi:SAM-dependent methyltransferase